MTALACADSGAAVPLLADLSAGPFDQKWGALPVAPWLLADATREAATLREFVSAGPAGVWRLAERHLPAGLADSLALLRRAGGRCPR